MGMASKVKKIAEVSLGCVACGCCVKVCKSSAISVRDGICAIVDAKKCVGCGKCKMACPACVITIVEKGMREEV